MIGPEGQLKDSTYLLFDEPERYRWLHPWLRWDAEYFLSNAKNKLYEADFHHAFYPGYPLLMSGVRQTLFFWSDGEWAMPVSGLIVSNIAFILAAMGLYKFVMSAVRKPGMSSNQTAKVATYLFCLNPASVFASSLYSESLYAAFTMWGSYILLQSLDLRYTYVRRVRCFVAAVFLYSLATLTRSNGVLLLIPLFLTALQSSTIFTRPFVGKIGLKRELVHWTVAGIGAVIVIFPWFAFSSFGYTLFCEPTKSSSIPPNLHGFISKWPQTLYIYMSRIVKGSSATKGPEWCANGRIPSVYRFIQQKYWNIGLFKYWRLSKLDRWIIGLPFYLCGYYIVFRHRKQVLREVAAGHHIMLFVLLTITLFTAHVEVSNNILIIMRRWLSVSLWVSQVIGCHCQ